MSHVTELATGHITNRDEITVILIEPTDGTPPHTHECIGRNALQQPSRPTTLLWRRRSYASSPNLLQL